MCSIDCKWIFAFLKFMAKNKINNDVLEDCLLSTEDTVIRLVRGETGWVQEGHWRNKATQKMGIMDAQYDTLYQAELKRFSKQMDSSKAKAKAQASVENLLLADYQKRAGELADCYYLTGHDDQPCNSLSFTVRFSHLISTVITSCNCHATEFEANYLTPFLVNTPLPAEYVQTIKNIIYKDSPDIRKNWDALADYLVNAAKATWKHTKNGNKQKKSPSTPTEEISLLRYSDLIRRGFTSRSIAEALVENDYNLYQGILDPRNEGDASTWEPFLKNSETFAYLVDHKNRIVGNWSFLAITRAQEDLMFEGNLFESTFSPKNTEFLRSGREYRFYLLNLSCNEYSPRHYQILLDSLWAQFLAYARNGVFFRRFYINLFLDEHKALWSSMGFHCLAKNIASGEIYGRDLYPFTVSINTSNLALATELKQLYDQHFTYHFEQLHNGQYLSQDLLEDISLLIYETDPYIYPALFTSKQQAIRSLPFVMAQNNDSMFSFENMFVARSGDEIVGLILYKIGPLHWKRDFLLSALEEDEESVADAFPLVENEYFKSYDTTSQNVISIINFCVTARARRNGVGRMLMGEFLKHYPGNEMELFVLAENPSAIRLYEEAGFQEACRLPGFAVGPNKPECLQMIRKPDSCCIS